MLLDSQLGSTPGAVVVLGLIIYTCFFLPYTYYLFIISFFFFFKFRFADQSFRKFTLVKQIKF